MSTEIEISYKEKVDIKRLPEHIAIIMDGNGRWAKAQGKHRIFGHKNGVKAVREVTEGTGLVRHGMVYPKRNSPEPGAPWVAGLR